MNRNTGDHQQGEHLFFAAPYKSRISKLGKNILATESRKKPQNCLLQLTSSCHNCKY
jgi:hypothetical protein